MILQRETCLGGRGDPHFLKVDLFIEGAEPEDRREEDSKGRVEDEEPVEHDETDGYVVSLDDCAHGDDERDGVEDAEDHADCGPMWTATVREIRRGTLCGVYFECKSGIGNQGQQSAGQSPQPREGGNAPVRSISVRTRFLKASGAFQRMLNAIMTPPAARRKKSRAPQRVISTMDTIVVLLNPVNSSKVERRHAGGCQSLCHGCSEDGCSEATHQESQSG